MTKEEIDAIEKRAGRRSHENFISWHRTYR